MRRVLPLPSGPKTARAKPVEGSTRSKPSMEIVFIWFSFSLCFLFIFEHCFPPSFDLFFCPLHQRPRVYRKMFPALPLVPAMRPQHVPPRAVHTIHGTVPQSLPLTPPYILRRAHTLGSEFEFFVDRNVDRTL